MRPTQVKIGTVIAGRYRLVAPLSRGGMGSVWRAEHLSLGSPIAIKLIDVDLVQHEEPRARFEQEARAAAALRSPHVVQILDHGVDKDLPFIAMELLDGESLAARLQRLGALPSGQTARIFADVARAMKKAHDIGIVHRDLKPDNVFLVKNDDNEIAKVLDFGIAKAQHPLGDWKGGTRTGALIGTPQYMSPEQAQGLPVDYLSDLWALGVIAFECVCGRLPFPSENPGALILQICAHPMPIPSTIARVPPRFDAWFARACQRDPGQRFSSAKEMADTLAEVLGVAPRADVSGPYSAIPQGPASGPKGTQMAMPLAPTQRAAPIGAVPAASALAAPADHPGLATMNGGAVVDSDPATLLRLPASRIKKLAIGIAGGVAVIAGLAVWWAMASGSGHVAGTSESGPESSALVGSPGAPSDRGTTVTPVVAPSAPATAVPSESASARPVSGASTGAGVKGVSSARAQPSASASGGPKRDPRIGF